MEEKTIEIIEFAREIVDIIADKKGEDIALLDLRERTIIADYFIVCSAGSERQLKAIVNGVTEEVKKRYGLIPRGVEGEAETGWVLIDYGDVVVHAFAPEVRSYYDLESFWVGQDASVLLKMQ
jgi:ribosome-associated protein